jgi:hypothetical protein
MRINVLMHRTIDFISLGLSNNHGLGKNLLACTVWLSDVIYYTDLGQKVVQPGMEVLFPVLHLQFL